VETGVDGQGRRVCGPRASAPPAASDPITVQPPQLEAHWIRLTDFDLADGVHETQAPNVPVRAVYTKSAGLEGTSLQYRIAEGPLVYDDAAKLAILDTAEWIPAGSTSSGILQNLRFRLSDGGGEKFVYFQIRAYLPAAQGGGAWIASPPLLDTVVLAGPGMGTVVHQVAAADAFSVAKAEGFSFTITSDGAPTTLCSLDAVGTRLVFSVRYGGIRGPGQLIFPGRCMFGLFGGRSLADGWAFGQPPPIEAFQCPSGSAEHFASTGDGAPAYRVSLFADFSQQRNPLEDCSSYRWAINTVLLVGPAGGDWRDAFR
jgi:hypothetical protein